MVLPPIQEIAQDFDDITDLKYLDDGGQKTVLSGFHSTFGDIVLKITGKLDDRTRREIDILTHRRFPGVPVLFDWGSKNLGGVDVWYLVEERIQGRSLRSVMLQDGRLEFQQAVDLLEFLLRSVAELEADHLVHRDIKPENIMVADNGSFYLLDFGIARALDKASLTATASRFGPATIGYAAPEQIRNIKKQLDSRADLFSIGVVFYECITGTNPFFDGASSQLDVLKRTETFHAKRLQMDLDKDGGLSSFIDVLMQKWPSRRPRSASEALHWYIDINTKLKGT